MTISHTPSKRDLLTLLRALKPESPRPLSWLAAEHLAARQAQELAKEAARDGLPVDDYIAAQPDIHVRKRDDLPVSGATYWDAGRCQWVIITRASEPRSRQRFSLVHEYKHILDSGQEHELYDPRYLTGYTQAEMAADRFAADALMPEAAVHRLVTGRTIDPSALATHFNVTEDRMELRLSDLGIHITNSSEGRESA